MDDTGNANSPTRDANGLDIPLAPEQVGNIADATADLEYGGPRRPGAAMVVFDDVVKVYDDVHHATGMDHCSVRIDQGEFVFLVGPSGSGKSTFIRLMLKEIEPDTGKVMVGGRTLGNLKRKKIPQLRRNIGCVFQDYKLLPNRTVYENIAYALQVTGGSKREIRQKVPEVIQLVGLADKIDSYPDELSGGQQQRISIARALINRPALLIADEPTGNLDPETSAGIMDLLRRIHRKGTTVIVATHDVQVVNEMRQRVLQLEKGRVVRDQQRAAYEDDVADEIGLTQHAEDTTGMTAQIHMHAEHIEETVDAQGVHTTIRESVDVDVPVEQVDELDDLVFDMPGEATPEPTVAAPAQPVETAAPTQPAEPARPAPSVETPAPAEPVPTENPITGTDSDLLSRLADLNAKVDTARVNADDLTDESEDRS